MTTTENRVIKQAQTALTRIEKEGDKLRKLIQEAVVVGGNGNSLRFHSRDLVPIVSKIRGHFTLDDLEIMAERAGLNATRTQLFSAIHGMEMVRTVSHGFGRQAAVYKVVKK